ncbi:MAG: AAA family ATPase [Proteobacteria bacterium]|nr:AAA family ATPase [Pseudomonadota bacterium]
MHPHSPPVVKIPIVRTSSRLKTICLADVEPVPISWLWPEKIARGKVTMISGDPGVGKSLLTIALAATVSVGARWPVSGGHAPCGSVIMLSDEDSVADTIRPRLDAAGANCQKVHALTMMEDVSENGERTERSFSLSKDIERLSDVVERVGDVALIQIDPVSAYMGGTDTHKNSDVRGLLSPLSALAERFNVAIVIVTHLNKGSGSAVYRSVGSIAFTAAARSVIGVTKDRDDPTRRLVLPVKNNLGCDSSGMAYRIDTASNGAPVLMWEPDAVDIDINEVLNAPNDEDQWARNEVEDWLLLILDGGPVQAKDLKKLAAEAGHSWRTVERAKARLKMPSKKDGMTGPWLWWHPDDVYQKPDESAEVRHEDREDSPYSERGGLGGLRADEVEI